MNVSNDSYAASAIALFAGLTEICHTAGNYAFQLLMGLLMAAMTGAGLRVGAWIVSKIIPPEKKP